MPRLVAQLCLTMAVGNAAMLAACAAADPGEAAGPTPPRAARTDRYGDPLPEGAVARLGTVRLRHGGSVNAVAFAPDGKTLASASQDCTVRLWDVRTGKEVRCLTGHRGNVSAVAFTADGKTVASASYDGTVRLWDAPSGRELRTLRSPDRGQPGAVTSMALATDGKTLVTASRDGKARIWDLGAGKQRLRLGGEVELWLRHVALTPDGRTLATASASGGLDLWTTSTGGHLRQLRCGLNDAYLPFLAFSPDGKVLVVNVANDRSDGTVRFWEVASGKELRRLDGRRFGGMPAFSPDGRTVALGWGNRDIRILDAAGDKERLRIAVGPKSHLSCLAFSPDGKVLAAGTFPFGVIRLWDTGTGMELLASDEPQGRIQAVAFSPHARLLAAASWHGDLRLADVATGRPLRRLSGGPYRPLSCAFGRDGDSVVWLDNEGTCRTWRFDTGREVALPMPNEASAGALSPDGTLVVWADPTSMRVFQVRGGRLLRRIAAFGPTMDQLIWSPDSSHLLSRSSDGDGQALLWDTTSGRRLFDFDAIDLSCTAFSPDGRLVASSDRPNIALSEGGATDPSVRTLRLWEALTGQEVLRWQAPQIAIHAFAFAPGGRCLASAGRGGLVRLWSADSGKEVGLLRGHHGPVLTVAFSPDGRWLASGSDDTTVLVWDVRGLVARAGPQPRRLTPGELKASWNHLAGAPKEARSAVWALVADPEQGVSLLRARLRPVAPVGADRLAALINDLDSTRFAVRDRAARELRGLDAVAAPALRRLLQGRPSPEVRRRAEGLLAELEGPVRSPEMRRLLRAVEILEQIGSPDARQLLRALVRGALDARLTREAQASLDRLERRTCAGQPLLPGRPDVP